MDENQATILVVDDEQKICNILSDILSFKGYRVIKSFGGKDALKILKKEAVDMLLLDLMMPDMNGEEVLKEVVRQKGNIPVVMISAHGTINTAVEAIKQGAYDFIEKPLDADRILITVQNALEKRELTLQAKRLRQDIVNRYKMVGESPAIKQVYKLIELCAPIDSNVLISGESGTGKELVAQAIHNLSNRVGFPFVKINCAAIPGHLLESELFGYEKGAFTGAVTAKKGRIELAQNGTLFLDEIGDLNYDIQAKLLQVIEHHEFQRLGSVESKKINFRLIAATNKNLEEEVQRANFRSDLFYRLNTINIHLPPLSERKEDIPLLAKHFMENFCEDNNLKSKELSSAFLQELKHFDWPGNIRQLKSFIESHIIFYRESKIIDQPLLINNKALSACDEQNMRSLKKAKEKFEAQYINDILNCCNWNISEAAHILELDRTHLHRKIKQLNIRKPSV